ncbi:hypothetical protein IGI04_034347 [Brassica rapa subsp. trilocularis]|uniref:Uncharacterized protein n=1 Tax=Brassica rapa subsp. trilocularis TaxID=1813537 RepID=A0ABQ7L8G3_BRACM|nr:hypothetical protein IGI04_034347 [Brassica rapa subsp. trilocularis]
MEMWDLIQRRTVWGLRMRSRRSSMEALRGSSSAVVGGGGLAGVFFLGDVSLDFSGDGERCQDVTTRVPRC